MNILQMVFVALCAPFISSKGASLIHKSSPPSHDHDITPISEEDIISPYSKNSTFIIFDHNLIPFSLKGSIATTNLHSLPIFIEHISSLENFTSIEIFIGHYNSETNEYIMNFFFRQDFKSMFKENLSMSFVITEGNISQVIHRNHTDMTTVKNKKMTPFYSNSEIIIPFSEKVKFLLIGSNGRPLSIEAGNHTACSSVDDIEYLLSFLSNNENFVHLFIMLIEISNNDLIIRNYEREYVDKPLKYVNDSFKIIDSEEYMLSYVTVLRLLEIPFNEPAPKISLMPLFINDVNEVKKFIDDQSTNFDIIDGKPVNYFGLLNENFEVQFTIIHHNLFSIFLEKARISGIKEDIFVIDFSDTSHPVFTSILVFKLDNTDGYFKFDDSESYDVLIMKKATIIDEFKSIMSM